jgi:predicted amidophosphoribosyltransferase
MNNLRCTCYECGKPYHESWPGCPYCQAWLARDGETGAELSVRRRAIEVQIENRRHQRALQRIADLYGEVPA